MSALAAASLASIVDAFPQCKVLVVGDLMLDEFIWGKVSRISPEAPVPVVEVQKSSYFPGGAANVVRNLTEFVSRPMAAGVVGDDEAGRRLLALLGQEGATVDAVHLSAHRPTTLKTRIIARKQQVVRVDRESRAPLSPEEKRWLMDRLPSAIAAHDAVIIEDYAKGLLDQDLTTLIIQQARALGKIVTADPNPNNRLDWSGATAVKPNRLEAFHAAGLPYSEDRDALLHAAARLQQMWDVQHLLITLSEDGMLLCTQGQPEPYHIPARRLEITDLSGAGDTAIAVFTLALAAGADGRQAAELANYAAGVVVGKLGTATLTPDELRQCLP